MESEKLFTIILPTFNEKDNVPPLLDQLASVFQHTQYEYEILFIDDSTDNTPEIIQQRIQHNPSIRMIHRTGAERTGLATAFIRGFEEAKGKYICCMDSDLQHPPETIKPLVEKALAKDADIVVATRYIKGGSAEGLGNLYRRLVSIGLKYFTQIIFIPTRYTTDPGSGFFIFKKGILENIILQPRGFKILIEILMRARYDGSKVFEVPYKFLPRENDTSKASVKQGLEFLKHLWFIFRTVPEAGRFVKFCLVGSSGVVINLGLLYLLVEFAGLGKNVSWVMAVLISIFSNYFLNTSFTYSDKRSSTRSASVRRVMHYYLISLAVMGFNFLIYRSGVNLGLHYIAAAFIGILVSTLLSFFLVTKLIWKTSAKV